MSYLACPIVSFVCCIMSDTSSNLIYSTLFCPLPLHPISSLLFSSLHSLLLHPLSYPPLSSYPLYSPLIASTHYSHTSPTLYPLSCTVILSLVRTFTTLHSGLYGLSIEQNAANPTEIPVDPASVYEEDDVFLTALRNADLTMYSYGAPRTGSPAFTKVLYIFRFYVLII